MDSSENLWDHLIVRRQPLPSRSPANRIRAVADLDPRRHGELDEPGEKRVHTPATYDYHSLPQYRHAMWRTCR